MNFKVGIWMKLLKVVSDFKSALSTEELIFLKKIWGDVNTLLNDFEIEKFKRIVEKEKAILDTKIVNRRSDVHSAE